LQSLSIGGVDGTTRNRFRGMLVARHVRAKTGTLNGKSCLSGLVGDGDDVMAFSIMVQGFKSRSALLAVRGAQVAAVNTMMRYVQERGGTRAEMPTSVDVIPAGADYETGGDTETEDEASEMPTVAAIPERPPLAADAGARIPAVARSLARAPAATTTTVALREEPAPVLEAGEELPGPEEARTAEIGIAGVGSISGGVAPGVGLYAAYGGAESGLGVQLSFYGTGYRTVDGPGTGSTDWTRIVGAIGARYRLSSDELLLDLAANVAGGSYLVHGHGYSMNSSSQSMAVGLGAGARLTWRRSRLAPWMSIDAVNWLGPHDIVIVGVADTRSIPSLDLLLSLGASFRLW
jgi:hypothetical protein